MWEKPLTCNLQHATCNMINILSYDLPDSILIDVNAKETKWSFWIPDGHYLVLGQSNKADKSLHLDRVERDNIKVIKRPSGGESVILTPKTLVISVRLFTEKLENPQTSFRKINNAIIKALEELGVKKLFYKGISDISIGEKKILGSSIYRKKNLVFYHAVLNLSEDISQIGKYLQHPDREPDYRKGRDHSEFVTSLHEQGYILRHKDIQESIDSLFKQSFA